MKNESWNMKISLRMLVITILCSVIIWNCMCSGRKCHVKFAYSGQKTNKFIHTEFTRSRIYHRRKKCCKMWSQYECGGWILYRYAQWKIFKELLLHHCYHKKGSEGSNKTVKIQWQKFSELKHKVNAKCVNSFWWIENDEDDGAQRR